MFKKRVTKLTQNQFIRHNAVFFAGSMAVAFINYLYYPVVGRLLPNAQFGELQVIISTYLQMSIVLSVLQNISINVLLNTKDSKKARSTIGELEKMALYAGFAILIAISLLSLPLAHAFKFSSPLPFIAIAIAFVLAIPATFRNAYLQANQKFANASLNSFIGSSSKLLFSAILVLVALHTFGAVLGIALSQLVALWLANRQATRVGYVGSEIATIKRRPDFSLIRPLLPYAGFVLAMTLLTTLQISIDVTLVKYYLPPEAAGSYAAIATVARIIYFLTGSILAVLLSNLSINKTTRQNTRSLLQSLGLVALLGGSATLFFCLFPTFTVHLLFGARYDSLTHILPILSIAVLVGSTLNLFVTYSTALRRYYSLIFVALGSLVSLLFVIINTKSIEHIVVGLLIGSSVALIGLVIYTLVTSLKKYRHEEGR